jgi:flagellar hook-length control protein FliK
MNVISPQLDTLIDPTLTVTVDNTQSTSPTAAVPTDFSKLLAKQELPEFMLTPDLPLTLPPDQKLEKDAKIDNKDPADSDTETQLLTYFPYDINPLLGQIEHLNKTSQPAPVVTDQISENENTTPEVIPTTFKKPALNIQNATQLPDSTALSQLTTPDTATLPKPVPAPVIKNDFKKLLATQDHKLSENNEIDNVEVAKPKSTIESKLKTILTDTNLADPQKILTASMATPSLQQLPDLQDNKYMNVLSEFGSFINSQTAAHIDNDSVAVQTLYTNTSSAAETFRQTPQLEMETKIELLPATLQGLNKDTYNANIKIYPPELGHVLAKLKVDKNTAELVITADNNVVKQIIEAHLPQLRENFQSADITLTHIHVQTSEVDVGGKENNSNQQSNQSDNKKEWNQQSGQPVNTATQQRRLNSIIDTYA